MLLAAGLDDLEEILFRQTDGMSQNGRGDQSVVMKGQVADRLAWRLLDGAEGLAELLQGRGFHAPDQLSEDTIDGPDLGFTQPIDTGQEEVGHLLQHLGVVLGSTLFGAIQFRAQVRRCGRHGYPGSIRIASAHRNACCSGHSTARMAGSFMDISAAERTSM
jgi:hypothetical protein